MASQLTFDAEVVHPLSDDELAAFALAADLDTTVGDDAVCLWALTGMEAEGPLPRWYMPAPIGVQRRGGWRGWLVRGSVCSIIASFIMINASGLCNTYGQLHF